MSAVFDAQFRNLRDAFLRDRDIDVQVAYRPDGEVEYVYQADRLLVRTDLLDDSPVATFDRLPSLRGIRMSAETESLPEGLHALTIDRLDDGRLTVPEALDEIDRYLGDRNPAPRGGTPLASPNHVYHITPARSCPADEPSVPSGYPTDPWPPVAVPAVPAVRKVRVGVSDTGFITDAAIAHRWLADVDGDPDRVGPTLPSGRPLIPEYTGHGTFIAGVIRTQAPDGTVRVANHFPQSGALLESDVLLRLADLVAEFEPDVISLSAGSYTRNAWEPLSFARFRADHPDVVMVAAAGNDATDRPFYPAALDWVIGVGALAADQTHRAWFSNYGVWVDVYALGEGLVNAYATGTYEYQEPPRRPARQDFDGMARWDGTSFSTPLVAGLIAAELSTDEKLTAPDAARRVLERARDLPGVGPALIL